MLVHPLAWTGRQPALLGCRINSHHDETNNDTVQENGEVAAFRSDQISDLDTDRLAKLLNSQLYPESLANTVEQLLKRLHARRILIQMEYVHQPTTPQFHFAKPTYQLGYTDFVWMI